MLSSRQRSSLKTGTTTSSTSAMTTTVMPIAQGSLGPGGGFPPIPPAAALGLGPPLGRAVVTLDRDPQREHRTATLGVGCLGRPAVLAGDGRHDRQSQP